MAKSSFLTPCNIRHVPARYAFGNGALSSNHVSVFLGNPMYYIACVNCFIPPILIVNMYLRARITSNAKEQQWISVFSLQFTLVRY